MANSKTEARRETASCVEAGSAQAAGIELLVPQELRSVASLTARLALEPEFRSQFAADPALAISRAGLRVQPKVVDALLKSDAGLIDALTREAGAIVGRSHAFTWEGERMAVVPLVAAFLAGALVAEALHHHSPAIMAATATNRG